MSDLNDTSKNQNEQTSESEEEESLVNLAEMDSDSDCFGMDDDCFVLGDSDEDNTKEADTDVNQNVTSKFPPFEMLDEVSEDHSYRFMRFQAVDTCEFACAMQSERTMMMKDLPEGVFVKFFEDRLDLCTAMIKGPVATPYEGCLFFFDVQVSQNYPHSAPKVKYLSYTSHKLNPNLYHNGVVCLSLLGTWPGSPEELWSAKKSSLLQLFVSIQGLILVAEPFYNEPAFHNRQGKMKTDSEMYNEETIKLVLDTMISQIKKPPKSFFEQVLDHYRVNGLEIHNRIESVFNYPKNAPFPVSMNNKGFIISCLLNKFKEAVKKLEEGTPNWDKN